MNRDVMLAPFADEELHQFQGRGGQTMTYIEDETVMDRLDAGFGYGNWQVQAEAISENVVKVRLGVRDHGEWIWYEDFGYPNREGGESLKEAVSDGIRRCGRFVGIARDLYRKAPDERRTDQPPRRARPVTPETPEAALDNQNGTEHEELMGRVSRRGLIRKGTAEGYKLDARQGPTGHAIGFRLEIDGDKAIPQCLVTGVIGDSLLSAYPDLGKLVGTPATVAGLLYNVKRSDKPGSWYRLHVDRFENDDWIFPADLEPTLPEPPPDLHLVGEKPA